MEKINISEERIFKFVKEGLIAVGYPADIEVHSYVGDDDTPVFYATYVDERLDGHIKPLRIKDIVQLMTFSMELGGYDVQGIDIRVRDEVICYSINVNIVTYGDGPKKKKRRR